MYPEHKWDKTKFKSSNFFFVDVKQQRHLLDSIAHKLSITTVTLYQPYYIDFHSLDDWYTLSRDHPLLDHCALHKVLRWYNNSLAKALKSVYPEHRWENSRLNKPRGFWANIANQRSVMDELAKRLSIFMSWEMTTT